MREQHVESSPKKKRVADGEWRGKREGEDLDENSISRSSFGRWAGSPPSTQFPPLRQESLESARKEEEEGRLFSSSSSDPPFPTAIALPSSPPPLFFSDGGRGAKGGKEDAVIRSFLPPASIPAAPSAVVVVAVAVGGSDFPRLRLGGRKRRGRGKGWEEGASG